VLLRIQNYCFFTRIHVTPNNSFNKGTLTFYQGELRIVPGVSELETIGNPEEQKLIPWELKGKH
jgi:hypothetical protein